MSVDEFLAIFEGKPIPPPKKEKKAEEELKRLEEGEPAEEDAAENEQ